MRSYLEYLHRFDAYSLLPVFMFLLLAGCDLFAPGSEVHRGIIGGPPAEVVSAAAENLAALEEDGSYLGEEWEFLSLPDTARVGEPVEITVTTAAYHSCWEVHETRVSQEGLELTIEPFDEDTSRPGVGCLDVMLELPREIEAEFDEPGEATVRVIGRLIKRDAETGETTERVGEISETLVVLE